MKMKITTSNFFEYSKILKRILNSAYGNALHVYEDYTRCGGPIKTSPVSCE